MCPTFSSLSVFLLLLPGSREAADVAAAAMAVSTDCSGRVKLEEGEYLSGRGVENENDLVPVV